MAGTGRNRQQAGQDQPFSRPFSVDEIGDEPVLVDIEANESERGGVAKLYGLEALDSFTAHFSLRRAGSGRVALEGEITARVRRICVVSLDPFDTELRESLDVMFAPSDEASAADKRWAARHDEAGEPDAGEPPDPIVDGKIDLGTVATEFLALGLDPYPRKPGVEFDTGFAPSERDPDESPFAILQRLKDRDGGK